MWRCMHVYLTMLVDDIQIQTHQSGTVTREDMAYWYQWSLQIFIIARLIGIYILKPR